MTILIHDYSKDVQPLLGAVANGIVLDVYTISNKDGINMRDVVLARDVHTIMGNRASYQDWMRRKLMNRYYTAGDIVSVEQSQINVAQGLGTYGGANKVQHFITAETAKMLAMVEDTDRGHDVRMYFIQLEKSATEVQIQQAYDTATAEATSKWSGYYLSDPSDLNYVNMDNELRVYANLRYTHATTADMVSKFGVRVDENHIAAYALEHNMVILDNNGVRRYPVAAWDVMCGIDTVGLFIEYFGHNNGSMELDVSDAMAI